MDIATGLSDTDRKAVATGLATLLADTYSLYLKSHYYHWNVTGPNFNSLHLMFETHYNELALASDEIAERIRALGHFAPGTFAEFARLSSIPEDSEPPQADLMVANLVHGHETVIATARTSLAAAEAAGDAASVDLATRRIDTHEKTAWMLRSLLD